MDYLLAQAVEASKIPPPDLPPDADEAERSIHAYRYNSLNPLKALLESKSSFYEIEAFAATYPQSFLESVWPWFGNLIQQLSYSEKPTAISYRWDRISDFEFSESEVIQSLLTAITELAKQDSTAFLRFVEENVGSDLLAVHRLLACGLEIIAIEKPVNVLNYLLADSRRFGLGSQMGGDRHQETEKLIAAIFPHLHPENRARLEQIIRKSTYWQPADDQDIDFRRKCVEYNREHRLSLLKSIPDECLSPQMKRLKEEEERALPWFDLRRSSGIIRGGFVGPRMTKDEMSHADDRHLINLFNELSDQTRREAPNRKWSDDFSRAGGAMQQSRAFGDLVKDDPARFIRICSKLEPQQHESYAGEALVSLSEINFPADRLLQLVEELDQRGFGSEDFHDDAARALEKVAERNQGLPASALALLKGWLPMHTKPELEHYRSEEDRHSDLKSPILFGMSTSHMLSNGRGNIVRAIAEGHLKQNPPDLEGWMQFVRSQLGVEPHSAVWVDIVTRMLPLLNGDRIQATELFGQVICNCPDVLQYAWALYIISRTVGWFEPKETVQGWLEMLQANNSNFSQQAYGELLLIQYLQYQDEWSVEKIRDYLTTQENEALLCGLAHAASHLWAQRRCRAIAAEILCTLASSPITSIQHAVANVFYWSRDHFELNSGMVKLIQAVCQNQGVLLESADSLVEIIETEELVENNPEIVAEVCQSLLSIAVELTNPARTTAFIGENLTTIAIKLHRHPSYREVGLQIFEQLLALNFRETRSALEILDRKPNRPTSYIAPRRRLRSRRARRPRI